MAAEVIAAEVMAASMAQAKSPLIVVPSLLWAAWRGQGDKLDIGERICQWRTWPVDGFHVAGERLRRRLRNCLNSRHCERSEAIQTASAERFW
ncbi:hypothetical protein, partial [Bradyrhizobium cytisi]|uniref:hypothetical protein n=1 Tax=Bradyrhizobium cytisi TaxID=515489 RepID=UPI001AEEA096